MLSRRSLLLAAGRAPNGAWRAAANGNDTRYGGIVGALIAAVFGFTDHASLTDVRIKHTASMHMALNLTYECGVAVNPDGEGLRGGTTTAPRNRHVEA